MGRALLAAALIGCLPVASSAEDRAPGAYQSLLTPLLQGGTDILDQPLHYPQGQPNVTAAIVTLPPGAQTGWHRHEVPLFAHVLAGELTVDYGDKGSRIYRSGDSVLEAMDWPHNGTNTGTEPLRLLAVYMGGGDSRNTVSEPVP